MCSLQIAIKEGKLEKVEKYMNSSKGASCAESTVHNFLLTAISARQKAIVNFFLQKLRSVEPETGFSPKSTPLHLAVISDDVDIVQMILQAWPDVNVKHKYGETAFEVAVNRENLDIAKLLLYHGANVNARNGLGETPLLRAVLKANETMVSLLLEHKALCNVKTKYGIPVLNYAARNRNCLNIVKQLLNSGADINAVDKDGRTALHEACAANNTSIAELLLNRLASVNAENNLGWTPLHEACQSSATDVIQLLLIKGANVNFPAKDGSAPLKIVAEAGNEEVVAILLDSGADINVKDIQGYTPLLNSITKKQNQVVKRLIQCGADVNALNNSRCGALELSFKTRDAEMVGLILKHIPCNRINPGRLLSSAILYSASIVDKLLDYGIVVGPEEAKDINFFCSAISLGHVKLVEELLKLGADVNAVNLPEYPLFYAVINGYRQITKLLINSGAKIDAVISSTGETALHLASERGMGHIVRILLDSGCDINKRSSIAKVALDYAVMFHNTSHFTVSDCPYEVFQQHVIKLQAAHLSVPQKYLFCVKGTVENDQFRNQCEAEISLMKEEKISGSFAKVYEFVNKDHITLATYLRNKNIVQELQVNDYSQRFPLYASIIKINFQKSLERTAMITVCSESFHVLDYKLPDLVIAKLLRYLSDKDLANLAAACNIQSTKHKS